MFLQSISGFCRAKVLYGRLANDGQVFFLSFEQSGLLLIPTGGVRKVTYLQQSLAFIEEGDYTHIEIVFVPLFPCKYRAVIDITNTLSFQIMKFYLSFLLETNTSLVQRYL